MAAGAVKLAVRCTSSPVVVESRMEANNRFMLPEKRSVISEVATELGTMVLSVQVLPPSTETKMGALPAPAGLRVNAEAAICRGLAGFTAMLGSLSWLVSPLKTFGIIFTTLIIKLVFT